MSDKIYTIDEIKDILNKILDNEPVYQIVLFGSYAKRKATKKSDIDLDKALKYTNSISFEQFCNNDEKQNETIFAISQIGELVKISEKEGTE